MQSVSPPRAPATEQPTQPLPIGATLPPRHSDFKEFGLWLFPGAPVAAAAVGIPLHDLWIYTDDAMFAFAVLGLGGLLVAALVVFLFARAVSRGEDGRS
jgi:hypothetical protein